MLVDTTGAVKSRKITLVIGEDELRILNLALLAALDSDGWYPEPDVMDEFDDLLRPTAEKMREELQATWDKEPFLSEERPPRESATPPRESLYQRHQGRSRR